MAEQFEEQAKDLELLKVIRDGSQAEVSAAYAAAIKLWPNDRLLHGDFWRVANHEIELRWGEKALKKIKREAWRLVES